ncbi:MAG: hypothetical protein ACRERV_18355, partial [Methylococcales bacterium]
MVEFSSGVYAACRCFFKDQKMDKVESEQPIRVEATAGFTETKVKIRSGQRISIIASGEIDIGNGQRSGPDGTSISDDKKPAKNCPTGSLFAVVGDDNDDFICIGKAREFIASRD